MGLAPEVYWSMCPIEFRAAYRGYQSRQQALRTTIWADDKAWSRYMGHSLRPSQQALQEGYESLKTQWGEA